MSDQYVKHESSRVSHHVAATALRAEADYFPQDDEGRAFYTVKCGTRHTESTWLMIDMTPELLVASAEALEAAADQLRGLAEAKRDAQEDAGAATVTGDCIAEEVPQCATP